jgi:hypothetical protein
MSLVFLRCDDATWAIQRPLKCGRTLSSAESRGVECRGAAADCGDGKRHQ